MSGVVTVLTVNEAGQSVSFTVSHMAVLSKHRARRRLTTTSSDKGRTGPSQLMLWIDGSIRRSSRCHLTMAWVWQPGANHSLVAGVGIPEASHEWWCSSEPCLYNPCCANAAEPPDRSLSVIVTCPEAAWYHSGSLVIPTPSYSPRGSEKERSGPAYPQLRSSHGLHPPS